MTRKTTARLAGFMFLFYIATAYTEIVLFGQASRGEGIESLAREVSIQGRRC